MHLHVHHGMPVEGNEHMWLHVRSHESFLIPFKCGFKVGAAVPAAVLADVRSGEHTELLFVCQLFVSVTLHSSLSGRV